MSQYFRHKSWYWCPDHMILLAMKKLLTNQHALLLRNFQSKCYISCWWEGTIIASPLVIWKKWNGREVFKGDSTITKKKGERLWGLK